MKAPLFWDSKSLLSSALLPASWLYQAASACRAAITKPYQSRLPVICVGNITSGGTGKTPVTAFLAQSLKSEGLRPVILSRGYGGSLQGPVFVTKMHSAGECGDEPLMLARHAPVVIARNRAKGAQFIEAQNSYQQDSTQNGFDVIIMDDGMQNPQLAKDITFAVFDGGIGLQNGRIFPAGPLRTSLDKGLAMADFCLINGADDAALTEKLPADKTLCFSLAPANVGAPDPQQPPLVAFAGIGRPQRFFHTLEAQGYQLANAISFGDHHRYRADELTHLQEMANAADAALMTTEKDWVRLPAAWQEKIAYLPVKALLSDEDTANLQQQIRNNLVAKRRHHVSL